MRVVAAIVLSLCLSACSLLLQRPGTPTLGPIEAYAVQTGKLAPGAIAVLAPFFEGHEDALSAIRVQVLSPLAAQVTLEAGLPAITVLGSTWVVIPGLLDANGKVRGRTFSWTQPKGLALWAHEAWHIKQYRDSPLLFVLEGVKGICLSLAHGELYDHEYVEYEQEAIAFEHRVRAALEGQP